MVDECMPKILVVDDSAVDRRLVGGLLAKELAVEVIYASQGAEALAQIAAVEPDLVITDILMPQLDGLGLVGQVRERYPMIPVVLMTSAGSEELAFQALKCGASSYVPKRLLAGELVETVDRVLVASRQEREQARLMQCMTYSQQHFILGNDATLITPLIACLQQGVTRLGLFDDADRIRLGVALEEALVNAIFHGNLEIASEERQDRSVYQKLIAERTGSDPYRRRQIHVNAALSPGEVVIQIRDEGPGFDPLSIPDPRERDLEQISGRGLLLMRTFMDEVVYNAEGNEVTLVKRRRNVSLPRQDELPLNPHNKRQP